jgi:hypothetical protein
MKSLENPEYATPIDIERELQQKDYLSVVFECIQNEKDSFEDIFFIVGIPVVNKLMPNVVGNRFFVRKTCPTPMFDQTVFSYSKKEERLEYIWTVPDKKTCEYFRENALLIDPSEKELLQFVLDFYDGTLDRLCNKLNNEEYDSIRLKKG